LRILFNCCYHNFQQADTGTKWPIKKYYINYYFKGISGQSQNSYRGLVRISPNADNARNFSCDLINGNNCGAHTFLTSKAKNPSAKIEHEATTRNWWRSSFLLQSTWNSNSIALIVNGSVAVRKVTDKTPMQLWSRMANWQQQR
jgi:Fe-S cluster assembly protein SufB